MTSAEEVRKNIEHVEELHEDIEYLSMIVKRLESRRVSIEDTGPALEAIAAKQVPDWEKFDAGAKAKVKQNILNFLLPGLQVLLVEINEQLAQP